jgi:hypothetical protein
MLKIEITDPGTMPKRDLNALAVFLLQLAGETPKMTITSATLDVNLSPIGQAVTHSHQAVRNIQERAAMPGKAPVVDALAEFAKADDPSASTPPAPPAVPSVPTAAVPPAPPALGVDLDTDGLPWDNRIHASTRVKNADGKWRTRRGVDEAIVASVANELRAVVGAQDDRMAAFKTAAELGIVPNVPPPPPATIATVAGTSTTIPTIPPLAGDAVGPALAPPPPGLDASLTFPQLCTGITGAMRAGTLTNERLGEVLGKYGITSLPTLAAFPQHHAGVAADLGLA